MREWVHAQFNGSAEVLYWLTPKAAHTLIGRLLRKPPWRVLQHGDGHDGTDGSPWMGVYPNRSVTMRAVETDRKTYCAGGRWSLHLCGSHLAI